MDGLDLDKIRAFDSVEIDRFSKTVAHTLYPIVYSYLRNNEDAEEVIQDTILQAILNIKKFNSRSKAQTWVYRIAINKAKDLLKYKSRKKRSALITSLDTEMLISPMVTKNSYAHPERELINQEDVDYLFDAINQLPLNQREALVLMKLEGRSAKEVAIILDKSIKGVEGLIVRAKSNLLKHLKKQNN